MEKKITKKCIIERKLKFKDYNNCLKATQLENKISQLEKTRKPNSSNDDERIQPIDSVETYAYRTSKDLICKKEKTKCSNIINQYKK